MTEPLFKAENRLKERIKELNCLYNISLLVEEPDISLEGILQGVVGLLPPAWRYPDITCARISFGNKEFKTDNFRTTAWKQSADIVVKGDKAGTVEVYYLEEKPGSYEGPFLEEEKDLIKAIAERLGRIIERKRNEELLRESEKQNYFKAELLYNAPMIAAFHDKGLNIVWANKAYEEATGFEANEMAGRKCYDVWKLSKKCRGCPVITAIETGKAAEAELTPENQDHWPLTQGSWLSKAAPVRDAQGNVIGAIETAINITARKKAEETIKEQATEWVRTFDSITDLVFIVDNEHRFIRANKAFLTLLKMRPEELMGKKCYEVLHKLDRPWPGCPASATLKDKKPHTLEVDDPEIGVPLLISASPILDKKGEVVGVVHIAKDLTERKKLKEQLLQAQKMEALGKLAGGIAHDFNNILAGIMGYAFLLKNRLDQGSPLIADVEKIIKSSQRAADLTTALLAFTREGIYQPKPLNVNLVIDNLLIVIKETVGRKCDIRANLSPDLSSVFADESQIYQLIMNLCLNGCEAMPAGGKLTVKSKNTEPDDGFFNDHPALEKGPYIRISVSDTAAGMDSETRSLIFDPLFTTKVGRPGAGLGLAMAKGIIERHGGGIEVESEPGRGSTFIVYLPVSREEDRAVPPTPVETLKGNETILLVDDEEDVRGSIGIRLKWLGYTVIEAAAGEDALKVLEERKKGVDLVLLDMIMPGMDGAEAFEEMRKLVPDLPVIICTGYALDDTTQGMLQEGAAAFLQKPFKSDELAVKIRQVLDNR